MKELTGKTVWISRGTSRGYIWEQPQAPGIGRGMMSFGPEIVRFSCVKRKHGRERMRWDINTNDPRYETLNAVVSLLPKKKYKWRHGEREADEWEIGLDEYRAVCGREGPLKD